VFFNKGLLGELSSKTELSCAKDGESNLASQAKMLVRGLLQRREKCELNYSKLNRGYDGSRK
jgi:hypothetical protein